MSAAREPEIIVDLAAIRHNVRLLAQAAQVPVIAVVKADGYGHGMLPVAAAARAAGATWLATATLREALSLRASGDSGRILCWLTTPGAAYAEAIAADLDLTAYSDSELDEIATAARESGRQARVQLKIDTGLNRGGAARSEWVQLVERARAGEMEGLWSITGIWSHFACADDPDHPANDAQESAFREALAIAEEAGLQPELRHLANSAATLLRPSSRFDAVRCGIAVYGLDPAPGQAGTAVGLRPAMTVTAPLAMVKHLAEGESTSYGHQWSATRATTLGLVPLGYGDGVPRLAGNRVSVRVGGREAPVRGRICMDQFLVDLGDEAGVPGDQVTLFGSGADGGVTAQDWAQAAETINYEIVTRIGGRLSRRYVDEEVR